MFGHSEFLKNRNSWGMKRFERWFSVFRLERWMRLERKEARLSWQKKHQWAETRIKGSASSLYSSGLVQCQGLDGHPTGVATLPAPPWVPAHLLLLTEWEKGWLIVHVNVGNICAGWHTKRMPLPILEINALLTELFLRAGMQEVPWVSCYSSLKKKKEKKLMRNQRWTGDSQEPGIGHEEFGLAHSESQLIGPQINQT